MVIITLLKFLQAIIWWEIQETPHKFSLAQHISLLALQAFLQSNDTLSIKFGNSISGRKMFCVLYEAHHGDMDLYEVDSFNTTSLQEYTAPITGTSSSPKWYYLRFYHYWSSPQTLNFSYKIS